MKRNMASKSGGNVDARSSGSLPNEPEQRVRTCARLLTDPELRLLTLTGAPGVGKSWLVRQVVAASPQPAQVIELGGVDNWLLFLPTLAEQLGVTADPPTLWAFKQAVTQHLQSKDTLLVVDDFGRLMPATATVAELLETCPGLTLLVTSRTPLNLAGEQIRYVPTLEVPMLGDPETFAQNSSVRLFREYAPASADALAQVAKLCVRLEGLPLALLAAARQLPQRNVEEVLTDLDDPAYLKSWRLNEYDPENQTTLYDLLEWRYTHLSENERRILETANMFETPFGISALENVLSAYEAEVQVALEQVEDLATRGFFMPSSPQEDATNTFVLSPLTQDFLTLKLSNTDRYTRLVEAYGSYLAGLSTEPEATTYEVYNPENRVTNALKPSTSSDVGDSDDPLEPDLYEQDKEMLELLTEELTERELDVLQLVVRGLSNREVASHLDISHRTVSTHLSNIYGKLGVRTRTAAALRAHQLELVPNL